MFDPNIKVRVIADFKYRDESYLVANSHLSFDIYDSMKIAELITLYNPYYEYKDHLELPSIDSLAYHVREQLIDTYKLDKPVDSAEFLPASDKTDYEIGGDIYTPFGYSPYESEDEVVKPLVDSVVEVETHEPSFLELDSPKPSVAEKEVVKPAVVMTEEVVAVKEAVKEEVSYTLLTTHFLTLSKDELEDKSASEIKKAVLEIDSTYDYTNKVEAIKFLLSK